MPREPENIGEVVLGSAGQALEQLGQLYPQYQAGKRQALLNAFSMQLKLEAAESDRQVGQSRMAHLAALTRLADLRGEEVMLKMANFLPEIQALEAKARIKREGLEYSMGVAREAVSAPGEPGEGVVIPSGVKVWERPGVGKPRFTPYQEYQIGRREAADVRKDILVQANQITRNLYGTEFVINSVEDLDEAIYDLKKRFPKSDYMPAMMPGSGHGILQQLKTLRNQYSGAETQMLPTGGDRAAKPADMTDDEWQEYLQLKGM